MTDEEEDKRRVMTPPSEWGDGGDANEQLLDGDSGWLSNDDLSPAPASPAQEADASPTDSGLEESDPSKTPHDTLGGADHDGSDPMDEADTNPPSEPSSSWPDDLDLSLDDDLTISDVAYKSIMTPGMGDFDATNASGNISASSDRPAASTITSTQESIDEDGWITAENANDIVGLPEDTAFDPATNPDASNHWPHSDPEGSEDILTDHQSTVEEARPKLPLWSIAAIAAALVLLIIGSWGAISERSKLTARVSELQIALSNKSRQGDMTRAQEQTLERDNKSLRLQLSSLRDQYGALADEIAMLQEAMITSVSQPQTAPEPIEPEQMAAIEGVTSDLTVIASDSSSDIATFDSVDVAEESIPEPIPESTPQAIANKPAINGAVTGNWFVNVAAYSKQSMAEEWVATLASSGYPASISETQANGTTLYRVRVGQLPSRTVAADLRAQLEKSYGIGPLWVGKEKLGEPSASQQTDPAPTAPLPTPAEASGRVTDTVAPDINLTTTTSKGGWFIYVDTYSEGSAADALAEQINAAGFDAKVAVEYRSGELFYRLQVVGIANESQGKSAMATLSALPSMPRLQLRQY